MMVLIIAGGLLLTSLLTFLLFKHIGLYHKFKKAIKTYEDQIAMLNDLANRNRMVISEQNKLINNLCDLIESEESN